MIVFQLYFLFGFLYLVKMVVNHFEHTYKVVHGMEWISEHISYSDLVSKQGIVSESFFIKVNVLAEYEAYKLNNDPTSLTLSKNYSEIGDKLTSQLDDIDEKALVCYLDTLDYICRSLSDRKNRKKYVKVANLYSYIVTKAIKSKKSNNYTYLLRNLMSVAEEVESDLDISYKPLSTGGIFIDLSWIGSWDLNVQDGLVEHFKNLLRLNVSNNDSDSIVQLFDSVNNCINFHKSSNEFPYFITMREQTLFGMESASELTSFIEKHLDEDNGVKEIIDNLLFYKNKIIEEAKSKDYILSEKFDENFSEFKDELLLYRFKIILEAQVLDFIALSTSVNSNVIIGCRENKNPIGADSIEIGASLLPSSIKSIIHSLSRCERFSEWSSFRIKNWSQYVLKGLSVLFIYEMVNNYLKNADDGYNYNELNRLSISDLRSLDSTLNSFKQSIKSSFLDAAVQDLLMFHSTPKDVIISICLEFIEEIHDNTKKTIECKLESSELDERLKQDFINTIIKEAESHLEKFNLFHRVIISSNASYIYNLKRPRESLLSNTGVYYSNNGIGSFINQHLKKVAVSLLKNKHNAISLENALPVKNGHIIIIGSGGLEILKSNGFSYENDSLIWPDNEFQCPVVLALINSNYFTLVQINEPLVQVSFENAIKPGIPISIEFEDYGKEVEWKIGVNIRPIKYRGSC